MTHPGNEPTPLWLKQVPRDNSEAVAVWSRRLIPRHVTIARSSQAPTELDLCTATVEREDR